MNYPIQGPFRIRLLLLEWFIAVIYFEWALVLLIKILKYRKDHDVTRERAFVWICTGLCIQWIFFILSEFHAETIVWQQRFLYFAYIIPLFCLLRPVYIIERLNVFIKKFIILKTLIVLLIISIITLMIDFSISLLIVDFGFWIILFSIFLTYSVYLVKERSLAKANKKYNRGIIAFIVGFLVIMLSIHLTNEVMVDSFGFISRYIGDIIQIIGLFIISVFFFSIPHLSEYDWKNKINEIFILLHSGICIYNKNYTEDPKLSKPSLDLKQPLAGGLKSIEILLNKLGESPGRSVIESEGVYILIEPSNYITGVIISQENLSSLKKVLKKIVFKIETIYSESLKNMNYGLSSVFKPVEEIIDDFLS